MKFRYRQLVKVVNKDSFYYGCTGKLVGITNINPVTHILELDSDGNGDDLNQVESIYIYARELAPCK